jgi:hypothetical protein
MYGILVYMLWIRNLRIFGKTMDWHGSLYVCFVGTLNDTSGMPFDMPLCRRLNQISYIRREFSLLEEELSLELRIC